MKRILNVIFTSHLLLLLLAPSYTAFAQYSGTYYGSGAPGTPVGNDPLDLTEPECINDNEGGSCCGMPEWSVSEPFPELWLHDRPLWYQPSRGPMIAFDLFFKNIQGTNGAADNGSVQFHSVGTNWHTPWRVYAVRVTNTSSLVTLFRGNGSARTYTLDDVEYKTHMKLSGSGGFTLSMADGETWHLDSSIKHGSVTNWYLTSIDDRFGNTLHFSYEIMINKDIILTDITDPDGNSVTLNYTTAGPYANVISSISAPGSRTVSLAYDSSGRLTNIVDMGGLSTTFVYDSTNNLRQVITPYGTNTFTFWASNGWYALRVTEKALRTNFWLYLDQDGLSRLPTHHTARMPSLPAALPSSWDTNNSNLRNSFYWNQRRIEQLSASFRTNLLNDMFNADNVTTNDFQLGRQRHWLRAASPFTNVSETLSFERQPTPDGVAMGQITWFDYEGKPSGTNWMSGVQSLPRCTAWLLPDSTTRFSFFNRNALGNPTNEFQSYESSSLVRSNRFEYAANSTDMTRHIRYIGASEKLVVSNVFNSAHLVRSNWNALEEPTVFTYEGSNRLTSISRPSGLLTTNVYGPDGYLSSTVDKDDSGSAFRTNAYTWTNGWVLTHTDPRGMITTNTYDAFGRAAQVNDALGVVTYTYDKLDLIKTVDRMGFVRSNLFDPLRRLVRSADARNNSTSYRYCSCGSLDYMTNAVGEVTHYTYDYAGRLTTTFYSDGYNVTNTWNSMGELAQVCDNAGVCLTNIYNQQGLLTSADTAGGRLFSRTYDIEDHLVSATDQNGVTTTNLFDALGRVFVRGLQATNSMEGFAWHARGLLRYTNQFGHVTTNGYDALGRKVGETNANGEKVLFTYAPGGELLTLTDGKSQVTTWTYDRFGRVTNKADNLGTNVFVYRYDANSRLTYRWTPEKGDTGYTNDANGNVTLVNYSNSTDVVMSYDALNRLTNMVDAIGTTRYVYNAAGLLASEDGPWDSDTVSYEYTNSRQRSKMTLIEPNASDWVQTYAYDLARRLTNTTSPAGAFTYDYATTAGTTPAHLVRKLTLPSGAYITNGYDGVARMINTTLKNSIHTVLNVHSYEVNTGHQRTKQSRYDNSFVDYTYDPIGQLSTALGKESGGTTNRLQEQFRYTYDAAGNLSTRVENLLTNTFNVNSLNELTTVTRTTNFTLAGFTTIPASSVTVNTATATRYADNTFSKDNLTLIDGNNTFTAVATDTDGRGDTNILTLSLPASITFIYDLNGNLRTNGTRIFEYDDENQLTRITEPNTCKSDFAYDGIMRRRVRKEYNWRNSNWVLTNEVQYVYGGNLVIQERDQFNIPALCFTRGQDLSGALEAAGGIGGLLALSDFSSSVTAHYFYHVDGNGNVTTLIDTPQSVVARYCYEPYGTTISATGPAAELNFYRFSSKEWHPGSSLIYYLYRAYDASQIRWISRDPIYELGGPNLFSFVDNHPTDLVDDWGLRRRGRNPREARIERAELIAKIQQRHAEEVVRANKIWERDRPGIILEFNLGDFAEGRHFNSWLWHFHPTAFNAYMYVRRHRPAFNVPAPAPPTPSEFNHFLDNKRWELIGAGRLPGL